jgi:DNA-binding IclR family transcriptional regulator
MRNSKTKQPRLTSVAKAIRLLQAFAPETPELGISDLAKRLGLAKSTVHRLASTLIEARLLEQNAQTVKYRLGLAIFELGALVASQMDVSTQSVPYLERLMEKTGETVHLAILDENEVLYINKIESLKTIRMYSRVGRRGPVYCTGVGKALLAFQPSHKIEEIIASGLAPQTEHTIVDPETLRRHLADVRARGYAIDNEEIEIGLRCVAAPVRDHSGNVIASISVAGPSQRLTKERLISFSPDVIATADTVSQRLGFREPRQVVHPLPLAQKGA